MLLSTFIINKKTLMLLQKSQYEASVACPQSPTICDSYAAADI